MNAFCASENFYAFMLVRSSRPGAQVAENSGNRWPSLQGTEHLEGQFEGLLRALEPKQTLFDMVRALFKDAWDARLAQGAETANALRRKVTKIEKDIATVLDRILEVGSASMIKVYEDKIAKLEREKLLAQEQLSSAGKPVHTFEEMFELSMNFLVSPWKLWNLGRVDLQRKCSDWRSPSVLSIAGSKDFAPLKWPCLSTC